MFFFCKGKSHLGFYRRDVVYGRDAEAAAELESQGDGAGEGSVAGGHLIKGPKDDESKAKLSFECCRHLLPREVPRRLGTDDGQGRRCRKEDDGESRHPDDVLFLSALAQQCFALRPPVKDWT